MNIASREEKHDVLDIHQRIYKYTQHTPKSRDGGQQRERCKRHIQHDHIHFKANSCKGNPSQSSIIKKDATLDYMHSPPLELSPTERQVNEGEELGKSPG
jgi:hypothetical protein